MDATSVATQAAAQEQTRLAQEMQIEMMKQAQKVDESVVQLLAQGAQQQQQAIQQQQAHVGKVVDVSA
ncbi:MAG: hypothetical protein HY985_10275 [Magnetospirillum sp.]|nr:hypothetical protein [Magnetospirillum sp.]